MTLRLAVLELRERLHVLKAKLNDLADSAEEIGWQAHHLAAEMDNSAMEALGFVEGMQKAVRKAIRGRHHVDTVREALTPPISLQKVVTVPAGKVAHPTYRGRLKTMRAPVVPTHGWPAGSKEERDPNWAWRLAMMRDERPESINTPTIDRRWTPVELVADPVAPSAVGWHAQAARKMAVGRVFCFQPNVGVVTFEVTGNAWSVHPLGR